MNKLPPISNLSKIKNTDPKATAAQIEKHGREFETLLLQQMIAAMEPKEGMFGQGFGGSYFQSLFREEMAKHLSKELKLGLAEQMMKAHLHQEKVKSSAAAMSEAKK